MIAEIIRLANKFRIRTSPELVQFTRDRLHRGGIDRMCHVGWKWRRHLERIDI